MILKKVITFQLSLQTNFHNREEKQYLQLVHPHHLVAPSPVLMERLVLILPLLKIVYDRTIRLRHFFVESIQSIGVYVGRSSYHRYVDFYRKVSFQHHSNYNSRVVDSRCYYIADILLVVDLEIESKKFWC